MLVKLDVKCIFISLFVFSASTASYIHEIFNVSAKIITHNLPFRIDDFTTCFELNICHRDTKCINE